MILLDYDFTDKLGAAIRYSDWETGANTTILQSSQSHLTML